MYASYFEPPSTSQSFIEKLEMKGAPLTMLLVFTCVLILLVVILGIVMASARHRSVETIVSEKTADNREILPIYLTSSPPDDGAWFAKVCYVENGTFQCGIIKNPATFTLVGTGDGEFWLKAGEKYVVHDGSSNVNLTMIKPLPYWRVEDKDGNMMASISNNKPYAIKLNDAQKFYVHMNLNLSM